MNFSILFILLFLLLSACSTDSNSDIDESEDVAQEQDGSTKESTNGIQDDEDELLGEPDSELIKKAEEEGEVTIYSETSRIDETVKSFEEKYDIKVNANSMEGSELITKVGEEAQAEDIKPDVILVSGTSRIQNELLNPGHFESSVPDDVASIISEDAQDPLSSIYVNTVFVYNSETYTSPPIKNIWEMTESEWEDKILMANPAEYGVLYEFFAMITAPEWSEKIADAYKEYYDGEEIDKEEAGLEWLKAVYPNIVFTQSNENNTERVGIKGQDSDKITLIPYSKLRSKEEKDLAVEPIIGMTPFSGFMVTDMLLTKNETDNPNAAELLVRHMFTKEGYSPWHVFGNYSPNPDINAIDGDMSYETWKTMLVESDPEFLTENQGEIEDIIDEIK